MRPRGLRVPERVDESELPRFGRGRSCTRHRVGESGPGCGAGGIGVHYNASKAGLEGLTRGYAARLAADGITVNAIAPGLIDTEMPAPLKAAGVVDTLPVRRIGTPDEIGQAVLMVMGNAFLTGQTVAVNGGGSFL